jgi:hypothetical protein
MLSPATGHVDAQRCFNVRRPLHGRGLRLCNPTPVGSGTGRGPKDLGQRPPHHRRALDSELQERTADRGPGLRRGGGTSAFPDPPAQRDGASRPTHPMAVADAFAAPRPDRRGEAVAPKGHGQRPPRPGRALLARRAGRWPLSCMSARTNGAQSRAGGGNDMPFPDPPAWRDRASRPTPPPHHGRG